MAGENEPAKLLLPYLQRADELQKHEPLVAYYCRLYAMERGLKFPANERTKTTKSLLASLMNQLEKDKKSLKLAPDDHLHLEGFALNVFSKADKQDRAGRADINTAKTFYAASIFFEILNQFGEIAPDLEQKQKYAVWKAADIRKALKEGRKPVPGPPGGEADDLPADMDPSSAPVGGQDIETRDTVQNINPHPEPDIPPSLQFPDGLTRQPSNNIPPSPPSFASADYPTYTSDYPAHDYQSGHSSGGIENPTYPQPHHSQSGHSSGGIDNPTYPQPHHSQSGHSSGGIDNPMYPQPHHSQSYAQDPQHLPHVQQNYPSQDIPTSYSYPNFQSYPSFAESSLPAAPSHYPSYYQGSDASYSRQPDPSLTSHALAPQYSSNGRIGNAPEAPPTTQMYHYDSNYQVPPEKISEAQKAARFAVGALAFDEVPVAVEHLRKALELLTNPSAGH